MKTTCSLLKVFSEAPSKSTPIALSPFSTLPALTPMSKLKFKQLLKEIKASLSPSPTLPTQTPICKLYHDVDHCLQEIMSSRKTNHPEDPHFQEIMTILKTQPVNKTPTPPEQSLFLEQSFFLPGILLPFLPFLPRQESTGPLLEIISQMPSRSIPISLSPSPTLSTQTQTQTPIFKTNGPFKATSPLEMQRLLSRQEYGIAVKAIQDFRTMLEDGSPMSHNLALAALFKEEMCDVAMAIYGDMLKRNFPRDCMTFNCVIDGLCKAGKIQDAIHLFDEMAEMGISPDTTTYTNLLNGFCKFHRMDEAFMFLSSFLKKGYVVSFNVHSSMIDGLFGTGRFEEACKYYKNLLEDNIAYDMGLYRIMIKGYTDAGKIDDGFGFVKEMFSMYFLFPDTYSFSLLFKSLVDAGLRNMAQLFVKDCFLIRNFIFDPPIQPIMAGWLSKAGFVEEAEGVFDKMVREEIFHKFFRKTILLFSRIDNNTLGR